MSDADSSSTYNNSSEMHVSSISVTTNEFEALRITSPVDSVATFDQMSDEREASHEFSEPSETSFDVEVTPSDLDVVDIQGLSWSTSNVTRDQYRSSRITECMSAERARGVPLLYTDQVFSEDVIYEFNYMNKMETNTFHHFQLRHLLSAPTARSVYYSNMNRIRCWDPMTNNSCIAVNMTQTGLAYARASTLAATPSLLWIGGFAGEVLCRSTEKNLCENEEEAPMIKKLGQISQNIINHIHACDNNRVLISSNDCKVRELCVDDGTLQIVHEQSFDYPINACCTNNRLWAIVGDSRKAVIVDSRSGRTVLELEQHIDDCFSVAWHKEANLLATASQDHTVLVHDLRSPSDPLVTIPTIMSAARNVLFHSTSLIFSESDDFIHILDIRNLRRRQLIDFFGEVGGIDACDDSLYIAITGISGGGVMRWKRKWDKHFVDQQGFFHDDFAQV